MWANGGFVTKHTFGVYGTDPRPAGFKHDRPQPAVDALQSRCVAVGDEAAGAATIEAYTVTFDREGSAQQAIASCLLPDGRRAWTLTHDDDAAALTDGEWVGHAVTIGAGGRLRL